VLSQFVLIEGLNAEKAESINKVFVLGITISTGLSDELEMEVEDFLHAIKTENKNKNPIDPSLIVGFKA
jgi:F0F1-type ATP synthase delta subunit